MKEIFKNFAKEERKRGNSKDINIDELYNDFEELVSSKFSKIDIDDDLYKELKYLELIYFRNSILWINIHLKFNFKEVNTKDKITSLFYDFSNILTITQNNLLVLHNLISKGFNYQAINILRNHLELYELSYSLFGDENQYEYYKKIINTKEEEIHRTIKFSTTQKVNSNIFKRLKNIGGFEIEKDFFNTVKELKKSYYDYFSSVVHPNRTSIAFGAYVPVNENQLENSYGGRRSIKSKGLLYDIFNIEVILFHNILILQIKELGMSFNNYEQPEKMAFLTCLVWSYHQDLKYDFYTKEYDL